MYFFYIMKNKYNKKNPVFYLPSTDNKIIRNMLIICIRFVGGGGGGKARVDVVER